MQVGTLMTAAAAADIDNPKRGQSGDRFRRDARSISPALPSPMIATAPGPKYFKHLGFYAYRKPALDRFVALPESALERSERLEQLRFLENGIPIYVAETPYDTVGVDTEEDLRRVEDICAPLLRFSKAFRFLAGNWVASDLARAGRSRPHRFG